MEAEVNGQGPFTFAVDTGASGLGRADASLTDELNLPFADKAESSDGVTVSDVDTVKIDSLNVGGLIRTDLELISRDYSSSAPAGAEISGIVGRDFFDDGLLVIDFPNKTLTYSKTIGLSTVNEGSIVYERPYRIPVTIGDVKVEANLDTGAGVALVLPQALYDQVSSAPLETAGRARLTNTTVETGLGIVSGPITIGETVTSNVEARVSERFPEPVVGGHILQAYVIAIDQRSKRVAVCPGT
ncbi:aspartyl protease family protein [Hyphomonas sp.]|uniref:aspartyl protease family protein n=1 Tax=Hyphomonas sp. TaxID=87 RepID=UPI003529C4CA